MLVWGAIYFTNIRFGNKIINCITYSAYDLVTLFKKKEGISTVTISDI